MPIFTFEGPKVRDLYVLGDIFRLIARLKEQRTKSMHEVVVKIQARGLEIGQIR